MPRKAIDLVKDRRADPSFAAEGRLLSAGFWHLALRSGIFPGVVVYGCPEELQNVARTCARQVAGVTQRNAMRVLTGRQFLRAYRDAVQTKTLDQFRSILGKASVFALEGLEFIAKSAAAQEQLVGLLDSIEASGGVWVASTSLDMSEWGEFSSRLRSRLEAGLTIPWASLFGTNAETSDSRAAAAPRLGGTAPEPAATQLGDTEASVPGRVWRASRAAALRRLPELTRQVARIWGLSVPDIRGPARHRAVATARQVAMFLARKRLGLSFQQIGQYFGGRDHSTVAHACRRIAKQLAADLELRSSVASVEAALEPEPALFPGITTE